MAEQAGPPDRVAALDEVTKALQASAVESDVFVDVFARAHGLGRSDLNAIMWIATGAQAGAPLTAGELAARLGLGAPATTSLIDRLEAAGHLERTRDPRDRRRVTLSVQASALRMARDFFQPLGERMALAVGDLPTADLLIAAEVIRRMTTAVVATREAARRDRNSAERTPQR
ncbi:MarR family transcriptional regulator [Catellatospora vulcania]|uniref:MarR family transcriptional regulator n=1 Tax=Catellatospora vulcania TaxID=1460450 RepID=UPI0012D4928A|nr:MarR family transcriptional regulator [Catellatospora vulcania]